MSTEAQIAANRANAQHSTGPKTEEGKAASCKNNFRWGFTGAFTVLDSEDQDKFDELLHAFLAEHSPATVTETLLVEKMAQAIWLSRRAQNLQDIAMGDTSLSLSEQARQFSLFIRYQTTNDRAFQRCLHDLLKLRAEKRKARLDEAALSQRAEDSKTIGFESQHRARQQAEVRAAAEKRKQDLHKLAISLAQAKLDHQALRNATANPAHPLAFAATNRIVEMEKAA